MKNVSLINLIVSFVAAIISAVIYGIITKFDSVSNIIIDGCITFVVVSVIYSTISYFYNVYKNKIEEYEREQFIDKYFYHNYVNDIAIVEHVMLDDDNGLFSKFSYINKKGEYIINDWFDVAVNFNDKGTAQVSKDDMFYIINKEGKVISKKYDSMTEAENYIAKVVDFDEGTVNFINTVTGKELWKKWKKEM